MAIGVLAIFENEPISHHLAIIPRRMTFKWCFYDLPARSMQGRIITKITRTQKSILGSISGRFVWHLEHLSAQAAKLRDTDNIRNCIENLGTKYEGNTISIKEVVDQIVTSIAVGRLGTAEEVANAVVWLSSDQSTYVTGNAMVIDGAFTVP